MLRRPLYSFIAATLLIASIGLVASTPATAAGHAGNIWAWGDSDNHNNGDPASDGYFEQSSVPAAVTSKTIIQVSAGTYTSATLDSTGTVSVWGRASETTSAPPSFLASHPVKSVVAGDNYFLAVTESGSIVPWGYYDDTVMVIPAVLKTLVGGVASGSKGVDAVDTSYNHALALSEGKVYAWGNNTYGQTNVPAAIAPGGSKTAVKVAAAKNFSMALDSEGKVYVWGDLNPDTSYDIRVPTSVDAVTVKDIAARGGYGLMALDSSGHIHHWGAFVDPAPVALASKTVVAIAVGGSPTYVRSSFGAVTSAGETYVWGPDGTDDVPGFPSVSNEAFVPPFVAGEHVTSISMSGQHQLVVIEPEVEQGGSATVSGSPVIGQTLTAGAPTYTPADATPTYQWLADGNPIANATGPTHYVSPADLGQAISVRVTGVKGGFKSAELTSSSTTAVTRAPSATTFTATRKGHREVSFKIYVKASGVASADMDGYAAIYRGKTKLKRIKTVYVKNGYVSYRSGRQPKGKQYYRVVFRGATDIALPSTSIRKSVTIR